MVYAVSDVARREAQSQPAKTRPPRGLAAKARAADQGASIHWPRLIALGLNIPAWIGIVAAARWIFHH